MKCKSSNCFLVSFTKAPQLIKYYCLFSSSTIHSILKTLIQKKVFREVFNPIISSNDQYQEVHMPAKHYFKLQISLSFTSTEVMSESICWFAEKLKTVFRQCKLSCFQPGWLTENSDQNRKLKRNHLTSDRYWKCYCYDFMKFNVSWLLAYWQSLFSNCDSLSLRMNCILPKFSCIIFVNTIFLYSFYRYLVNEYLAWISSDYFESLLLPQEKTTRSNRMNFRLTSIRPEIHKSGSVKSGQIFLFVHN